MPVLAHVAGLPSPRHRCSPRERQRLIQAGTGGVAVAWTVICADIYQQSQSMYGCVYGDTESVHCQGACSQWFFDVPSKSVRRHRHLRDHANHERDTVSNVGGLTVSQLQSQHHTLTQSPVLSKGEKIIFASLSLAEMEPSTWQANALPARLFRSCILSKCLEFNP